MGPPNLQLGLSSDQYEEQNITKRLGVVVAAVAAVILQTGLIAIATVTVYHDRTRRAIAFVPDDYGYPCYVIGTVLLCIGVGICAKAVERNTTKFDWRLTPPEERKSQQKDQRDLTTLTLYLLGTYLRRGNVPESFGFRKAKK